MTLTKKQADRILKSNPHLKDSMANVILIQDAIHALRDQSYTMDTIQRRAWANVLAEAIGNKNTN